MEISYPEKVLHVGDFALFPKTVSASDVTLFAGVSGDGNPLYLNETYGNQSGYRMRVVPPMLIASMMGGAVYRLLRPSAYPLERSFTQVKPMQVGDTLTTRAEIREIDPATGHVRVELTAYNAAGELVMQGESVEEIRLCRGGAEA